MARMYGSYFVLAFLLTVSAVSSIGGENENNELSINKFTTLTHGQKKYDESNKKIINNKRKTSKTKDSTKKKARKGKRNELRNKSQRNKKGIGRKSNAVKEKRNNIKVERRKRNSKDTRKSKEKRNKQRSKKRKMRMRKRKYLYRKRIRKEERNKKKINKNKNKTKKKRYMKCGKVATEDLTCITNANSAWNYNNNHIRNFIKITKRLVRFQSFINKKYGKSDIVEQDAYNLESVLGGSCSAPSCQTKSRSSEAGVSACILKYCRNNIRKNCSSIDIDYSLVENGSCNTTLFAFKTEVEKCGLSCPCYSKALTQSSLIINCTKKAYLMDRTVKDKWNSCRRTFSECKSHQDKALGFIASCHKPIDHPNIPTTRRPKGSTRQSRRNWFLREMMQKNMRAFGKIDKL